MNMKTHSEHSWSLLTDRPLFLYDPHYDARLCYWNGFATTRSYAAMVIANIFCGITVGQSQKQAAWDQYLRYYSSGAWGHHDWDSTVDGSDADRFYHVVLKYINNGGTNRENFFQLLKQRYTPQQAFAWLKPTKL